MSRAEEFQELGYAVTRGLFSPEEVEAIKSYFMKWNARDASCFDTGIPEGDPLRQYPRIIHPHREGGIALDFLLDHRIQKDLVDLTGDEPFAAQTMFYFKPPGARGQALHQDQWYLRAQPGTCIAAWLAIDDCDEENGCMSVVPGSENLPLICPTPTDMALSFTHEHTEVPTGYEAVPVHLKAGDVLYFTGNLIHGSGPNRSATRFRRSLIAHYISSNSRQVSSFYKPLLRFDGSVVEGMEDSPRGGSCGKVTAEGIEMVDLDALGTGVH